jgi:hypothetical protein
MGKTIRRNSNRIPKDPRNNKLNKTKKFKQLIKKTKNE